eukprot:825129-Pyramimonas_sp.AAC.2
MACFEQHDAVPVQGLRSHSTLGRSANSRQLPHLVIAPSTSYTARFWAADSAYIESVGNHRTAIDAVGCIEDCRTAKEALPCLGTILAKELGYTSELKLETTSYLINL